MCPIPTGFRDRPISLYDSKIVDKKEILRAVSNTSIYCSSDKVDTFYLVLYIFENSTVNINALRNPCEDVVRCLPDASHLDVSVCVCQYFTAPSVSRLYRVV
jgi:hypothetical protein